MLINLISQKRIEFNRKTFKPNRKFRQEYRKLFKEDPLTANTFLLLAELADEKGQVTIQGPEQLTDLLMIRFEDPMRWAL
jgi:hypothetical protein